MPAQPLSATKGVRNIQLGPGALNQRPGLASLVLATIEAWSSAESHFIGIAASLLRTNHDIAMAMLAAVESQAVQRSIVLAAARQVLAEDDFLLLESLARSASERREARNKFAHHIWGISPDLPDALLLMNPKHHNITVAAYEKWRRLALQNAGEAGPQPSRLDRSKVYVWRDADLMEAHRDALSTSSDFMLLAALLTSDLPPATAEAIRRQLSSGPLARKLARHRSQQRNAQAQAAERRANRPTKPSASQRRKDAMKTLGNPIRKNDAPPTTEEDEVLRRMLNTPPTPHKVRGSKPAPAKKPTKKVAKG